MGKNRNAPMINKTDFTEHYKIRCGVQRERQKDMLYLKDELNHFKNLTPLLNANDSSKPHTSHRERPG